MRPVSTALFCALAFACNGHEPERAEPTLKSVKQSSPRPPSVDRAPEPSADEALDERVDIRAISGDEDPLAVALRWLRSRHHRDVDAAILYFLSDPERSEKALLAELDAGRRTDRVARALAHLGRRSSVPALIKALDVGTEHQRLAVRAALLSIGGDEAQAALATRGLSPDRSE